MIEATKDLKQGGVFKAAMVAFFAVVLAALIAPSVALADDGIAMQRLYNPNTGEHFYTADVGEKDALVGYGWQYEGVGWIAPATSDWPVYRLYSGIDHHYSLDANEREYLISVGWSDEGIGWYSADESGTPLYRQFNPNATGAGAHNYTADVNERNVLVSIGWNDEGIGWYGISGGDAPAPPDGDQDETTLALQSLNGWWQSWGQSGLAWWHFVNGTVYAYEGDLYDSSKFTHTRTAIVDTIMRFEADQTVLTDYSQDVYGGYQIFLSWNEYSMGSWLYFDNMQDDLICSELDGSHYSGTSSRHRVADPPQELLAVASENE